jgi:predicted SAM-dependent methyltransferase
MLRLNLGCGPVQPEGWENVDGSLRAWLASRLPLIDSLLHRMGVLPTTEFNRKTTFAKLKKRLPWADASVDCVYMGELLEHFTRADGEALLRESFRILRQNGIIRLRVPDNARFWRNYLSEFDESYRRPPKEWTEHHTRWIEMFFREICVRRHWLRSYGHYHKWMYDEISLVRTLERVGFIGVERRGFLESRIPGIEGVETHADLTVEGTKP